MSEKINRKVPYSTTKVSWHRTSQQIQSLLDSYGVEGVQFTTYKGVETLKFIVETEVKGIKREIGIEMRPPNIPVRKRLRGRGTVTTRNKDQEYRLMYWWLKSKLEAVVWGLSTIEQEFLAQVMVSLPDKDTTVGSIMQSYIAHGNLDALPAPDDDTEARKSVKSELDQ